MKTNLRENSRVKSQPSPSKTIETLVEDIYSLFREEGAFNPTEESVEEFGRELSKIIAARVGARQGGDVLRLSKLGGKCDRKLWYDKHQPLDGEELPPQARIKFLYGDILEALLLFLAREAGHRVEGEQDEVQVEGVPGHRDAVIDGVVVDCKSASSFAYHKFESGLTPDEDAFGYLTQLDAYRVASIDDPVVEDKDRAALLVIDKQLGKICLDVHGKQPINYPQLVGKKREVLAKEVPPPRPFGSVPDGKSGNEKLHTVCSYCAYKKECWPGLRTFLYGNGPRFLTRVTRLPNVPEAK